MDLSTFKCPGCNTFESDNLDSLRIHAQKKHKTASIDLYKQIFLSGKDPQCECGCGKIPRFHSLQVGFMKFVRGHSSRINNNWGHNETALSKSIGKRREMWKNGEIEAWCKGKTKDSDPRIAEMSVKIKETIMNDVEERQRRSDYMTQQWVNKDIVPLTGSAHSQWKGGVSELGAMCRSRLYREWSFPKMVEASFKCTSCDSSGNLEVHHVGERFASILQKGIETLGEPGDDFDRKTCFVDWVLWYHATHDVSGRVLCSSCHEAIHHV